MHKAENRKYKISGFTIIEMMIAISIFLIVVMYGMNTLLSANLLKAKTENSRSILDNLSFVMEDMARNMRTGSGFRCFSRGESLPLGNMEEPKDGEDCYGIAFESARGSAGNPNDQWVYYLSEGKIF